MAVPGAYNALFGMITGYQKQQEQAAAQETQKKQANIRMILPLLFQQAEQGNVGLISDKGMQTYLKSLGVDPAIGEFFEKAAQQSKEKNAPREAIRNQIMQMMGGGGLGGLGGDGGVSGGGTPAPAPAAPGTPQATLNQGAGAAPTATPPATSLGALGGAAVSAGAPAAAAAPLAPPPPQQQVRRVGGTNPNLAMSEQLSKWAVALSLSGDNEGAQALTQSASLLLRNVEARNMMRKLQTDEEQLDSLRKNRSNARRQAQLEIDIGRRTTAIRWGLTNSPDDPAAGVNAVMQYLKDGDSTKIKALFKAQKAGTGGPAASRLNMQQKTHVLKYIMNMSSTNTAVSAMLAHSSRSPTADPKAQRRTRKGLAASKVAVGTALLKLITPAVGKDNIATTQELHSVISEGIYIPLINPGRITSWHSVRRMSDVGGTLLGTDAAVAGNEGAGWEIDVKALKLVGADITDTGGGIWETWDLGDGNTLKLAFIPKDINGISKLYPKITGTGIYASVQAPGQPGQPGVPAPSKVFD